MKLENVYIDGDRKGYEIGFQLPANQGTYVSNIDHIAILINGQKIDNENIWLRINNNELHIDQLSTIKHEYIDLKESLKIVVKNKQGLHYGQHDIEIDMIYLMYDPSVPQMVRDVCVNRKSTLCVENNFT